ncbi:tetratricopeptide repeat protein [candidate division KSB1 bacterium]|nr:tetratricopeptide repeat protein [candidate division KSB1 bacterium]
MLLKGFVFKGIMIISVLVLALIVTTSLMTGCATTGDGGQKVEISPERQKAIQDSLDKVYRYQLDLNFSIGNEHRKNKNYKDAVKPFWKVVKLDTINRFPDIFTFLADCYMKLDQPDSALIVFTMGTEKAPQKIHNHRMRAYLLAAKGEREEAINEYYKTIELDPDKIEDYKSLGTLLIGENRLEEALETYKKITDLAPEDGDAQSTYSTLIAQTGGDITDIIAAKEEALTKNPEDTRLMFELGELYFKQVDYKNSIIKFSMFLEKTPDDVRALEYLGNSYQNSEQYKKAIDTYEKVLKLESDHTKVICEMAACYRELKQFSKARTIVNSAIKIDSGYGYAHIVKGSIYEATADACINQRDKKVVNIDDKLVYKLAYDEFQLASNDIQFQDIARNRMNYVMQDIPTPQDKFMYPNKEKAELPCYNWIY